MAAAVAPSESMSDDEDDNSAANSIADSTMANFSIMPVTPAVPAAPLMTTPTRPQASSSQLSLNPATSSRKRVAGGSPAKPEGFAICEMCCGSSQASPQVFQHERDSWLHVRANLRSRQTYHWRLALHLLQKLAFALEQ